MRKRINKYEDFPFLADFFLKRSVYFIALLSNLTLQDEFPKIAQGIGKYFTL